MSRRSRIVYEADKNIASQRKFGQSKHDAKKIARRISHETGERQTVKGVFSFETDRTYRKQGRTFINWIMIKHPEVRSLEQAKKYVSEYLTDNINRGLSPHTVHTRAYSLACIFKCDVKNFGVDLPARKSSEAKRTRNAPKIEGFRSDKQYIHRFAVATGARRGGLENLRVDDLIVDCNGHLLIYLDEKGGKKRWARVLEHEREFVLSVIEDAKKNNALRADGCKKVFPDSVIPEDEPLHQHRRDYAKALYEEVTNLSEHKIVDRGLYRCRGERYGQVYDRTALAIVSFNLGHGQPDDLPHEVERVGVVVLHYFW